MNERDVIARLRRIATDPAARGLLDDVAVLDGLIITHDTIAEGVHFLPSDPAASVGWKLVAVNLSDLAAKGATPAGAVLSLTISGDPNWDDEFLTGVEHACESYDLPLIGGDTIALPDGAPRVLGMTALGRAGERAPARDGARPGDSLWLTGTVGDAAAGLALALADKSAAGPLVDIYRRPVPQLESGWALAPHARAMMDVSDGLLLDTRRMAEASNCVAVINLDQLPLSTDFMRVRSDNLDARLFAATGGDDYGLLAALPSDLDPATLSLPAGSTITRIGSFEFGSPALRLKSDGRPVDVPEMLGYEHRRATAPPMADRA